MKNRDEIYNFNSILNEYYISNQLINRLEIGFTTYHSEVVIEDCLIKHLQIHSAWFQKGLIFKNNIVKNNIDYQMGGHNYHPMIIENNIFEGFFNFFDCHFEEKIIIRNNIFLQGSNILGNKKEGFKNLFNKGLINENNIGKLNRNECL